MSLIQTESGPLEDLTNKPNESSKNKKKEEEPQQQQQQQLTSSFDSYKIQQAQEYLTTKSQQDLIDRIESFASIESPRNEVCQVQPIEPLIGGFAWLRVFQLLNFDVYYINLDTKLNEAARLYRIGRKSEAAKLQNEAVYFPIDGGDEGRQIYYPTILDDFMLSNPVQRYIDKYKLLDSICQFLKIFFSLMAIMASFDRTLAAALLCLSTRFTIGSIDYDQSEATNSKMGMFVLITVSASTMYLTISLIFNGHLIWNLFSRRLFLVSRQFQCRTMLMLIPFIYLEYIINVVFVDNLYDWDYTSNKVSSVKFSVLANLRILATEKDVDNQLMDTLMTCIQFSRGILRISPYITVNYAIICLREHINVIRNQHLLTESLKKRTKLRLAVRRNKSQGNSSKGGAANSKHQSNNTNTNSNSNSNSNNIKKKRVNFDTKMTTTTSQTPTSNSSNTPNNGVFDVTLANGAVGKFQRKSVVNLDVDQLMLMQSRRQQRISLDQQHPSHSVVSLSASSLDNEQIYINSKDWDPMVDNLKGVTILTSIEDEDEMMNRTSKGEGKKFEEREAYLDRIRDFDELESYITNLYIFTGRLNRFMSRQGLAIFFIVHNLVISASVIRPEVIQGGPIMIYLTQFLLVSLAFLPFLHGQSLNGQLEQLSKQIDRIIIQQQLTHNKRDNLVRIRELIHDIRVNCGGMLNFNVEDGIKYMIIAFGSAFFIEQEQYKLTRRH